MLVCGVDEAGRGPWAGPVVAAAVILDPAKHIDGLADSKVLTEAARETAYDAIAARALAWSVGHSSVEEIDALNILQATFLAMRRAVDGLRIAPSLALVDGNRVPALLCPVRTVVGGDAIEPAISAASIMAKVTRDRIMRALDRQYPDYQWARNKGYGTAAHQAALLKFGPAPDHRKSFRPVSNILCAGRPETQPILR
jgi:ribonuclease HII